MAPGRPMSLAQIDSAVGDRLKPPEATVQPEGGPALAIIIRLVLLGHPERFVKVGPDIWARRNDGPNAGMPSPRPRLPLAGGAAAAVDPPQPAVEANAVARPDLPAG